MICEAVPLIFEYIYEYEYKDKQMGYVFFYIDKPSTYFYTTKTIPTVQLKF